MNPLPEANWSQTSFEFLDSLDVGVIITDSEYDTVFYMNHFFTGLPTDSPQQILAHLKSNQVNHIDNRSQQSLSSEKGLHLGFSSYSIDADRFIILCTPISLRRHISEHSHTSLFFDRLSTFIAEIIHEIGNPLSTIITTLEVLKDNQSQWAEKKKMEYLEVSLNELQRLSRYLEKIRDVSKPVLSAARSMNLYTQFQNVSKRFMDQLVMRQITLYNQVAPELNIWADPDLFEQVMINLIINSLDSLKTGDEIRVSTPIIMGGYATLYYENTGPAIPDEIIEKIYTPFFSTKDNGGGIGLFTCMKLMTRMGGTISAKPALENGVRFELIFPVCPN